MKNKKWILKILVSIALLTLLFYQVDFTQFAHDLKSIDLKFFLIAISMNIIWLIAPAFTQKSIFKTNHLIFSSLKIYLINLGSMFYSIILPGDVASSLSRVYRFSKNFDKNLKDHSPTHIVISTILLDRFLNILGLFLVFILLFFLVKLHPQIKNIQNTLVISGILGAFGIFVLMRLNLKPLIQKLTVFSKRLSHFLLEYQSVISNIPLSKLFIYSFFYFIYHFIILSSVDLSLARAIHLNLDPYVFFSIVIIAKLARNLPISFGGIGLREGIYGFFFSFYGIPLEKAVLFGVVSSVMVLSTGLIGGLAEIYFLFKKSN